MSQKDVLFRTLSISLVGVYKYIKLYTEVATSPIIEYTTPLIFSGSSSLFLITVTNSNSSISSANVSFAL